MELINLSQPSQATFNNEEFNLEEDLHNGQIYLIKNKINEKCYIGQAICFMGTNNNKWGTLGRWKSHLREAIKSNQDHCVLLNNAIRKYGEHNFDVSTLIKCHKNDLDNNEIKFVKQYNSLKPFGYNLKFGGYSSKNNESTILKMKEAHTGKEHSDITKEKIGKSQIGNRRNSNKRRNDEDNDLPKYIVCNRVNNELKAYSIYSFPVGIDSVEYLPTIRFSISKYGCKENALQAAIINLNELKEKYKYIKEDINTIKQKNTDLSIKEKKENMLKDKLPQYIFPNLEENKIKGYYVDNILDSIGNKYPIRFFTDKTNRWNLVEANKYVDMLKYINDNNIKLIYFKIEDIEVNDINKSFFGKYYLPMYFNLLKKDGEIIGFCINGYPCDKYKDGKFKKEYRLKGKRLEEAYEEGIRELYDMKKGYVTI